MIHETDIGYIEFLANDDTRLKTLTYKKYLKDLLAERIEFMEIIDAYRLNFSHKDCESCNSVFPKFRKWKGQIYEV